jgi:hypothetical protein
MVKGVKKRTPFLKCVASLASPHSRFAFMVRVSIAETVFGVFAPMGFSLFLWIQIAIAFAVFPRTSTILF